MIKEIIMQWETNKSKLENWFRTSDKRKYRNYGTIVKDIFTYVIEGYDTEKIHVIDDGEWQGTQIFIIPKDTYQPDVEDYLITDTYYGSCSGCDALLNIVERGGYGEYFDEQQISELMTLSLHIVQKLRSINEVDEMRYVTYLMKSINDWSVSTFPGEIISGKIEHLKREVDELGVEIAVDETSDETREELADCYILLLGITAKLGVSSAELKESIESKMEINKRRKWGKPDVFGIIEHIKFINKMKDDNG